MGSKGVKFSSLILGRCICQEIGCSQLTQIKKKKTLKSTLGHFLVSCPELQGGTGHRRDSQYKHDEEGKENFRGCNGKSM